MSIFSISSPQTNYSDLDLDPVFSREQINYHLEHHQSYYDQIKKHLSREKLKGWTLEELLFFCKSPIQNSAAQYWYHNMYWKNLTSQGSKKEIGPKTANLIKQSYTDIDDLKQNFLDLSCSHFSNGWYVLGFYKENPKLIKGQCFRDAELCLQKNFIPLLVIDLWEHSYYLRYKKDRLSYLKQVWSIINWATVEERINNSDIDYCSYYSL